MRHDPSLAMASALDYGWDGMGWDGQSDVMYGVLLQVLGTASTWLISGYILVPNWRQFSDNPTTNNNIKIGLIVGFTLAAFLAIVITFLWVVGGVVLSFDFSISCISFECISASFFDFQK
ncbi:hypothetical protein FVER53590_28407 [Fusarium verticillioides]|nr:hypothetical protein FVER53590_28407 [Fusarium verticillioides]